MGYATTFYAVDLEVVRAAVGANDRALHDRILKALRASGDVPAAQAKPDPKVIVTVDGEILFNGTPLTPAQFKAEIREPTWAGTMLYVHERRPTNADERRRLRASPFGKLGSFAELLHKAVAGTRIAGISSESTEEGMGVDDEPSLEQAVAELLAGKFADGDPAPPYGYALEALCAAVGKRIGTIEGKGRLKPLKLKTPLSADRLPVPLPASDDFPSISYLTAEEVKAEVARLQTLPADPDTEVGRRQYAVMLKAAAKRGQAVVAFYY